MSAPDDAQGGGWPAPLWLAGAEDATVDHTPRVAVLIDYPMLLKAVHAVDQDAVPNLPALMRRARSFGATLSARAYGAWYNSDEALNAFNAGIDPVFVPPSGPGSVPSATTLVSDGQVLLKSGRVEMLLLSGDDRLLPLVTAAQEAGVQVLLLAHSCKPGGPCLQVAEEDSPASSYARLLTRSEKYRRTGPTPARSA